MHYYFLVLQGDIAAHARNVDYLGLYIGAATVANTLI